MPGLGKKKMLDPGKGQRKSGMAKLTPKEAVNRYRTNYENATSKERHKIVKNTMAAKFGKEDWRKRVYGKNYKSGTVRGLNKKIARGQSTRRTVRENIQAARSNLTKASGNAENKAAIEKRITELKNRQEGITKRVKATSSQRQKYLDLRNSAMENIKKKLAANPQAFERKRNEVAKNELERLAKGKKKKKTTSGGTEAP